MIIQCFRCGKGINSPDATNADYITADDIIEIEFRSVLYMRVADVNRWQEADTRWDFDKEEEVIVMMDKEEIDMDSIVDIQVVSMKDIEDTTKDISKHIVGYVEKLEPIDVQKTGIICPNCYLPTDTIIWGKHKKDG